MNNDTRRQALEAASIEAAGAGIKALLLLNGGACIALLGFLANVFSSASLDSDRARFFQAAISSLVWFSTGAGLSVIVSLFAYLSNQAYATSIAANDGERRKWWRRGWVLNNIGIGVAIASLLAFFGGVIKIWTALG